MEVATGLETAGFTTWYYERDGVPGVSYLVQMGEAIDSASAVVLMVSRASLGSHQVTTEMVRAYEAKKAILPITIGVTHDDFQRRPNRDWRSRVERLVGLDEEDLALGVWECLSDGCPRRQAVAEVGWYAINVLSGGEGAFARTVAGSAAHSAARAGARATTDVVATRNGLASVRGTLDRIRAGEKFPHRNDGSVFQNREGLLPKQPQGYYREYVHPTPGVNGAGQQRIIQG